MLLYLVIILIIREAHDEFKAQDHKPRNRNKWKDQLRPLGYR